jgi:hypothetical protein
MLKNTPFREMNSYTPQEPIFKRQQVQKQMVSSPRNSAYYSTGDSVEDEVVCGRDDGDKDNEWVENPQEYASRSRK